MKVPLDRGSGVPLYRQIVDFINQQMAVGNLPPGSLLPPIRVLADRLGLSTTTVATAYAELEATGRVEGRVGIGTVVIAAVNTTENSEAHPPPVVPQQAPGLAVVRDLFKLASRPGIINLATTAPDPEHLPAAAFGRLLREVLNQDGPTALGYESAEGYPPLRRAIARHLAGRGMITAPDEVLITSGAQQAIDLVIRTLVAPGEWVLVESPGYVGALEVCAQHRVRVAPVPLDEDGLDVDSLEPLLRQLRPRLLYTNPSYQNPTGTNLSLERRRRLVELANEWNFTVLEDAVCSDLELDSPAPPALRALGGPVIHCGSFSKSLLPGIRLGYLVAEPDTVQRLALAKQSSDLHSPGLMQRALAKFLEGDQFARYQRFMLDVYRERRNAALKAMELYFPAHVSWTKPSGGLHLWVTLPDAVSVTDLYVDSLAAGVGFTPGAICYPSVVKDRHLRLSYGAEPPERINAGIARLADLLETQLGKR